ncbi:MAG: OmpA family protein [Spirochaetales bacterium]|nr:OmpA family protein [Spirochaetales bacterium]
MKRFALTLLSIALLAGMMACQTPKTNDTIVSELDEQIKAQNLSGVEVEQTELGVKLTAGELNFPPDSKDITPETAEKLDKLAELIKSYAGRQIMVVGHTADVGDYMSQMELSLYRAEAVGNYLIEVGAIKPANLRIDGRGGTEPRASNETEEGRAMNRRVEIILLN